MSVFGAVKTALKQSVSERAAAQGLFAGLVGLLLLCGNASCEFGRGLSLITQQWED
ncbi:MAG: hypothetical protein ACUVX8_12735 [Candidatus Zipacnadales bacterium]